jgi:type IV fimbrial biogenesis protein FimT
VRRENHFPCGSRRYSAGPRATGAAAGFSLIEMLTTMSILAILLVIASPGLASLTSANALSAAQGELASALMLARGEALKRSTQVGLAATSPIAGAQFSGGWTIFVDANGNGIFDAGEVIVRQQPAFRGDVKVATASGVTMILFNGRGFLAPSTMVTLTVCSSQASKSYQLRLEPVGLADIAETTGCS